MSDYLLWMLAAFAWWVSGVIFILIGLRVIAPLTRRDALEGMVFGVLGPVAIIHVVGAILLSESDWLDGPLFKDRE